MSEQSGHTAENDAPRILVTGSRDWTDRDAVARVLMQAWQDLGSNPATVLVQDECHLGGADQLATEVWKALTACDLPGRLVHLVAPSVGKAGEERGE